MPQEVQGHQHPAARIDALVQEISEFTDPRARATAEELVQTLLDMYGEGLARLLEITADSKASGLELIDTFASDELLSSLFLLHGLHPVDIETRVLLALDQVRPYLQSHGGNVEFVKVEDNVAHLRLVGSCHGCPGSTNTLKLAIEDIIYKAAPDLEGLQVEGVTEPPARPGIPVTFVPPKRNKDTARPAKPAGGWSVVEGLLPLLPGTLKVVTVQQEPLLFIQIAGTYYAYHNRCGSCGAPLDRGVLEGTELRCSSCGRSYDVCHAGRCLDAADLFLEAVPLLVEDGSVKVALSALVGKDSLPQAALAAQASVR
jgi:Fe-S cluster biogenesis protein NfuA/nitrite reductase/ring-hydroxylating ferredoxin subunit